MEKNSGMSNGLFRKKALEKISYPEQLSEYIKITNPGVWVVALGCIAIVAAVVVWLVLGAVPDTVSARGVLFPAGGTISVTAPEGGKINDMRVEAGSVVYLHDIIAVVPQGDILAEIEELKNAPQPDEDAIKLKQREFRERSVIYSPVYGIVLSASHLNETVDPGEPVANIAIIEEGTNNYAVIAYIDMDTAQRLAAGMEVQISPSFAAREEYGYMYGYISSVSRYPVSEDDIRATVGNTQYVSNILSGEAMVEVRITILLDADKAEFQNTAKWSNAAGNELNLSIGTECDLLIVIDEQSPYEMVF